MHGYVVGTIMAGIWRQRSEAEIPSHPSKPYISLKRNCYSPNSKKCSNLDLSFTKHGEVWKDFPRADHVGLEEGRGAAMAIA